MITRDSLKQHDKHNQGALLSILALYGLPRTMIDIGSGSGIMTKTGRMLGINAIGFDLLAEAPDIRHDLNKSINIGKTVDLIVTIETAEHIANTAEFLQTIKNHTGDGTRLIFTAAPPGQAGDGHINCQTKEFWRHHLEKMGYIYNQNDTALIGEWWRYSAGGLSAWLTPNLQIFKYGARQWER